MTTLLEGALAATTKGYRKQVTDEQMELAIAWAEGKVATAACAKALHTTSRTQVVYLFARCLAAALQDGVLVRASKNGRNKKRS